MEHIIIDGTRHQLISYSGKHRKLLGIRGVYFLICEKGLRSVKIGRSNNIGMRYLLGKAYKQDWGEIAIVGYIPTDDEHALETQLHELMAAHPAPDKLRGKEWFDSFAVGVYLESIKTGDSREY